MLQEGTIVTGYRIDGILGEGGMGAVYEATQLSLNRVVALKLLAPSLSQDAGFRARFEREGQVQAALDHDHIVTVYEAGQSEYGLFLAMRLIAGPTLKQLILDDSLDPRRSLRLLAQVAYALDAAHAAGLIHRDVKPQNILIGKGDHAYLADFGLIKAPDEARLTGTGQFIGTIDYVAPEQIQAEPATAASDVYALTGVLYECLTGEVPFPKPSEAAVVHAHVMEPPPKVSDRRPDLPPAIDAVIAQGMAKDPWARPGFAGELIQSASRALASSTSTIVVPPPRHDGGGERERRAQTTKAPAVSASPGAAAQARSGAAAQATPARPADRETAARRDVTRPTSRPVTEPVVPTSPAPAVAEGASPASPVGAPEVAARVRARHRPRQLVALIVALTVTAFAAGFVLGLIVH